MQAYLLHDFEKWLRKHHEALLNEYEDMADECWDLDEWMEAFHPGVVADFEDWLVLEEKEQYGHEWLAE